MKRRSLIFGGLALAALSSCSGAGASPKTVQLTGGTAYQGLPLSTPKVPEMVDASQRLGWNFLRLGDRGTNAILSPSSLSSAFVLVGLGASGVTAEALDEVFGMGAMERAAATNALRAAMSEFEALPEAIDAEEPPEKPIAHQASHILVIGNEIEPKPAFLDGARQYFDTSVERLEKGDAKANLDAWVRQHSAGLIERSGIKLTPRTRLVVQDAILFAARWQKEFTKELSITFTDAKGTTRQVDGMTENFYCPYAKGGGWEAIRLPYNARFAMDVILPGEGTHPLDIETAELVEAGEELAGQETRDVLVELPRLDARSELDLKELFEQQGISLDHFDDLFDGAAVGQAVQQARLQITPKGTVGSAVTEIAMTSKAGPSRNEPIRFTVNRPYALRVIDLATGWPLFLAAIADPTQTG